MEKRIQWTLVLVVSCLVLTACSSQPEGQMTSAELERSLGEKLKANAELASADVRVTVDAERNEIRLAGVVESDALRQKAEEMVRSEQSSMTVTNLIDVRPSGLARADFTPELAMEERTRASQNGESIGDSLDDAWIHKAIAAKVSGHAPEESGVKIDVVNGVVTLRGTVQSADRKAYIEDLARETEAVQSVDSKLQVAQ